MWTTFILYLATNRLGCHTFLGVPTHSLVWFFDFKQKGSANSVSQNYDEFVPYAVLCRTEHFFQTG